MTEAQQPEKEIVLTSRKAFRKAILPPVGHMIENCKINYVHQTKLRFTAVGRPLPKHGQMISIRGAVYRVEYIDEGKGKFNASFIGFEKPNEPEYPKSDISEVTKLID